jgi:transposase-like protein
MTGTAFEATNCTRTQGKESTAHRDPRDPPRRRANQRKGHGTYAHDRPPIISIMARDLGEQRFWVGDYADTRTCRTLIADNIPAGSTRLYTDEWQSYQGSSHPAHATVRHGVHEWALDDNSDGRCEVHCYTCEGAGAALRAYVRAFRGVHKQYLHPYVATYEAMLNARRITPDLMRRMCLGDLSRHIDYT